jgi:hypothetical protein
MVLDRNKNENTYAECMKQYEKKKQLGREIKIMFKFPYYTLNAFFETVNVLPTFLRIFDGWLII